MFTRLSITLITIAMWFNSASASIAPLPFNSQHNTWSATHIVVVEDGKVIESWLGDLKPGSDLPKAAAEIARIPVPGPDPTDSFLLPPSEKTPAITGKRKVVFLAFVPRYGEDPKKPIWMGADAAGHPSSTASPATIAWLEGEDVYTAVGVHNYGTYAIRKDGSLAGLKQRVDLGIALRGQFESARTDKDLSRRADRIESLAPILSKYAGTWAMGDCAQELVRCGKAAVPIFLRWVSEPKEDRDLGLWGLSELGDVGIDGMIKVLDGEVAYWKSVANALKPGTTVRDATGKGVYLRTPIYLYHVLAQARRMKLSTANQQRLRNHAGLIELDRLLREKAGMKPDKSDMDNAHEVLKDILAGRLGEQ